MNEIAKLKQWLQEFAESGEKIAFDLKDGRHCLGFIVNVTEQEVEYADSGPLAQDEPYFFQINEIEPASLKYHDKTSRLWKPIGR